MQKFLSAFVLAVALLSGASFAQAGVITNASGHATGITGLKISGGFYNVSFKIGSFDDVFGSDPAPALTPTFAGDNMTPFTAIEAIVAELNGAAAPLVADETGATGNVVFVPYFFDTNMLAAITQLSEPLPWVRGGTLTGGRDNPGFGRLSFAFAVFTPAIPEPGTLALFGLGLAAFGFARRKQLA
ncbi:PEP-CTERM sorting domain-containing protein [Denitrobaculum tricleocarpae]|uniref:PEP-CTERM sorting domain-containing protein n=1 Tax=Denitrobaculum tricleocarpae TaxID=2591009 RepID=A0A545T7V3_9PROT|nr:PEP-CTERM sorting domain-containing protein [Denitrobaculum tricleocarpae]TQV73282.1 PEP-CTERM sorting domain-containing protein [Denitrobaculum tricleocarpae]